MMGRLFVTLQYLLPHHLLCRLVYAATRSRSAWLKKRLIRAFVRHYRPRLDEALEPDARRYESFNAFFTRALRPGARPAHPHAASVLSPCDGTLSIAADRAEQLLQAKGHYYSLTALLAGDPSWAQRLRGGAYATLYLAPRDYHRVHMPLSGRLCAAWHVPGRLFSVNAATTARVPGLFARNERVVCMFESEVGPFAVILVGALFVGSMSTVWHGQVTPWHARTRAYGAPAAPGMTQGGAGGIRPLLPATDVDSWQARGAELGRFNMGSTVILLLPAGAVEWDTARLPGGAVRVGEALGRLRAARPAGLDTPA
jgi:phosphatidylserine decarboxylase